MSDNEPRPHRADGWWSSGANIPGGVPGLGRVGGQPSRQSNPGYDQVPYQPHPPAGYTQPYRPPRPTAALRRLWEWVPRHAPCSSAVRSGIPGRPGRARLLDGIFRIPVIVVSVILATAIVRPWETVISSFGTTGSSLSTGRLLAWMFLTFAFTLIGWTLYEGLFTHAIGEPRARLYRTSVRNGTAISDPT